MGGGCCICGYNRSQRALALHHLDPNKKDFGLGSVRASPAKWKIIVKELRKCILVCHNCHCEIHDGLIIIPNDVHRFDESYADYQKLIRMKKYTPCPICQKLKHPSLITCSDECSAISRRKVARPSKEELEELLWEKPAVRLAKELGVSDKAIEKWAKQYKIKKPPRGYWTRKNIC